MTESTFPGLDYDFLRYIGVVSENQRRIQHHYVPYFEKCDRVVDLGCGDADLVALLLEQEIDVVGVDSDDKAHAAAAANGLPVLKADVFDWLRSQPDGSFDGVFSAHLIEHLPYPKVIELIRHTYRILKPGGVVLLVTPNVRSLYSHLEMFYLHFGHISFYHPRLVCFFLEHEGFDQAAFAENPETASPLLSEVRTMWAERTALRTGEATEDRGTVSPESGLLSDWSMPGGKSDDPEPERLGIPYRRAIPLQGRTPLHYVSHRIKRWLINWLVLPFLDDLARGTANVISKEKDQVQVGLLDLHRAQAQLMDQIEALDLRAETARRTLMEATQDDIQAIRQEIDSLGQSLQSLNGAFEAYMWAHKPAVSPEEPAEAVSTTDSGRAEVAPSEEDTQHDQRD